MELPLTHAGRTAGGVGVRGAVLDVGHPRGDVEEADKTRVYCSGATPGLQAGIPGTHSERF